MSIKKIDFSNIVYINRDIDVDRKKYMENQFFKYGIEAKRFSALCDSFDKYSYDWRTLLKVEETSGFFYDNIFLSKAEIGCLLSHLECLRLYGSKDLIVMEDDLDMSTSDNWNFKFSEFIAMLSDDLEILQMVKYNAYLPINVKKLKIGNEDGGSWGTAAYYIKSSLSERIVSQYYVDGKWNISDMECFWNRKTADAILYSFETAYTCTLFSLAQEGTSTINGDFNPSLQVSSHISDYFKNNTIGLNSYFEV